LHNLQATVVRKDTEIEIWLNTKESNYWQLHVHKVHVLRMRIRQHFAYIIQIRSLKVMYAECMDKNGYLDQKEVEET